MYLRKYTDKRINKTYLSIARGYQNSEGKTRTKVVQYLGSLDELQKQYDDPIAHFKEVIKKMNEEEKLEKQPINLKLNKNEHLTENTDNRKNFGYAALSKVYHELEIDKFLISNNTNTNFQFTSINNRVIICIE